MNSRQKQVSDMLFNTFAQMTRDYAANLTGRKYVESREIQCQTKNVIGAEGAQTSKTSIQKANH